MRIGSSIRNETCGSAAQDLLLNNDTTFSLRESLVPEMRVRVVNIGQTPQESLIYSF
jgi:hypothetical protein